MPRRVPADRFHALLRAATEVFIEQGYRRTQMADVAERLGVAKGTLYLYVESKEALLDAALRHADAADSIPLPPNLPLPTPSPGATLQEVEKRVAQSAGLPRLTAAIGRKRVAHVRRELEEIVRELYELLASHRVAIKLLDRCAHDYPELAAVWHGTGRGGSLALLRRYLEERVRRGSIPPVRDVAVTARTVLELVVFWAVHRHWDPTPELFDEVSAREAVVELVVRSLTLE